MTTAPALFDGRPEIGQGEIEGGGSRSGRIPCPAADARVGQEIVDQGLYPVRAVHGEADELVGVGVDCPDTCRARN